MAEFPYKSKTFWSGVILIALGIYLYTQGNIEEGTELVFVGLGLIGIRHAIERKNP